MCYSFGYDLISLLIPFKIASIALYPINPCKALRITHLTSGATISNLTYVLTSNQPKFSRAIYQGRMPDPRLKPRFNCFCTGRGLAVILSESYSIRARKNTPNCENRVTGRCTKQSHTEVARLKSRSRLILPNSARSSIAFTDIAYRQMSKQRRRSDDFTNFSRCNTNCLTRR